MADVATEVLVKLTLSRREFVLVTKALVGKLRPNEIEEARQVGEAIMKIYAADLTAKTDAANHAVEKAMGSSED